ncbi:MAG: hypothetical protein KDA44_02850 [Planctomycetales bacterium]|nr:hypothetical protein [Planctomycetales bacterium]
MTLHFRYRVRRLLAATTFIALLLGAATWYFMGTLRHATLQCGTYRVDIARSIRESSDGESRFYFQIISPSGERSPRHFLATAIHRPYDQVEFGVTQDLADSDHLLIYRRRRNLIIEGTSLRGINWPRYLLRQLGIVAVRVDSDDPRFVRTNEAPVMDALDDGAEIDQDGTDDLLSLVEILEINGAIDGKSAKALFHLPNLSRLTIDGLGTPVSGETVQILSDLPSLSILVLDQATAEKLDPAIVMRIKETHPALQLLYYDLGIDSVRKVE